MPQCAFVLTPATWSHMCLPSPGQDMKTTQVKILTS